MAADPALEKGCHWAEKPCPVVGEKSCWASRLVYSLACTICRAEFVGTTGLTLHARGRQHLEALLGGNLKYPMTKHYKEKHPGQEAANGLVIKPVTGFLQQNISRYLTEAMELARGEAQLQRGVEQGQSQATGCGGCLKLGRALGIKVVRPLGLKPS